MTDRMLKLFLNSEGALFTKRFSSELEKRMNPEILNRKYETPRDTPIPLGFIPHSNRFFRQPLTRRRKKLAG